eukprot:scaffold2984_cov452-Prasinococcus_capsulatus_cf.AAC.10
MTGETWSGEGLDECGNAPALNDEGGMRTKQYAKRRCAKRGPVARPGEPRESEGRRGPMDVK